MIVVATGVLDEVGVIATRLETRNGATTRRQRLMYPRGMAFSLRLSDSDSEALQRRAAEEGRSIQEIAESAISEYLSRRPQRLRAAIEKIRSEDAQVLDRLGL